MKANPFIFIVGLIVGLLVGAVGLFAIGTNASLRDTLFPEQEAAATIAEVTATPRGGIRAPITRDDESVYYRTNYNNALPWLDGLNVKLSQELQNEFLRVDETISVANIKSYFEDPTSTVNQVLNFVRENVVDMLPIELSDQPVEACLVLEKDLIEGRFLYLYLRVPATSELDFSADIWEQVEGLPAESNDFKSECPEISTGKR